MKNLNDITKTLKLKGDSFTLGSKQILQLRGTKVFSVDIGEKTQYVTTWSSLIRQCVESLQLVIYDLLYCIGAEEFSNKYKMIMEQLLQRLDIKLNSNCPIGIYKKSEIDNYINSSVYINNKNHNLVLFNIDNIDYAVCAVYTGEIIIVLQTLLMLLYKERGINITLTIKYTNREDLAQYNYYNKYERDDKQDDLQFDVVPDNIQNNYIMLVYQMRDIVLNLYKMSNKCDSMSHIKKLIQDIYGKELPYIINNVDNG